MIQEARADSISDYNNLTKLNPYEKDVSGDLKKVADMFSMDIQFEDEWIKFIGFEYYIAIWEPEIKTAKNLFVEL